MQAIYYEQTGPANEVLKLGELPTPLPGPGEVRVKVAWSGVNPSDVKTRAGLRTKTLPFPRIVRSTSAIFNDTACSKDSTISVSL